MVLHWELRQRRRGWARSVWGTWYFMNFHVLWGRYNLKSHFGVPENRSWNEVSLFFPFFRAHKTANLWAVCPSVDMFCICALFWNNTREKRMLIDHKKLNWSLKKTCKLILGRPQKCVFQARTTFFQTAFPLRFCPYLPFVCYISIIALLVITVGLYQASWYRNIKYLMDCGIINEHAIPLRL